MAKARKPAIDLGNAHRQMERWSFSDQHQYDIEKRMKTGDKSPKGKPRSWREAAKFEGKGRQRPTANDLSEERRKRSRGKQLRGESPKQPWRIQMKREMSKDSEYGRRVRAKRAAGYTIYEDASMGKRKRRG